MTGRQCGKRRDAGAVALFLLLAMLLFSGCTKTGSMSFQVKLEVQKGNVLGANTDKNALDFGILPPSGGGGKTLKLGNTKKKPCLFRFSMEGELKDWAAFPESAQVEPGEEKEIGVRMNVPPEAKEGAYESTLRVETFC